jgi:hypothetical protein
VGQLLGDGLGPSYIGDLMAIAVRRPFPRPLFSDQLVPALAKFGTQCVVLLQAMAMARIWPSTC